MSMLSKLGIRPDMSKMSARYLMDDSKARRIGSGQSTTAYAMTFQIMPEVTWEEMADPYSAMQAAQLSCEDRVIRVSTNETGMRTTIAIAMKHQSDAYAPKVYETMELQDGFVCVMERLTPEQKFLRGAEREARYGRDFNDCGIPLPHMRTKSPYVAELMSVMDRHGVCGGNLRWDTHDANFAMRGKQLVVLDPLYCSDHDGPLPEYRDENYRAPRPMARIDEALPLPRDWDIAPRIRGHRFDRAMWDEMAKPRMSPGIKGLVTLKRERDLHRLKQLDNLDPNRIKLKGF